MKPKALVICGDGINCEVETSFVLEMCGFDCKQLYVSELLGQYNVLSDVQVLVIPGGFAFGDEIASGKVLALKLQQKMQEEITRFIEAGKLLMGVCNGFQVLTQLGVLPFSNIKMQHSGYLAGNSTGKFINRWVRLKVNAARPSLFLEGLDAFELTIRHGEGRLALAETLSSQDLEQIENQACLKYAESVNGSYSHIAALTNERGNVFGIMPHPEAFVRITQHPAWAQVRYSPEHDQLQPAGLRIFKNVFKACV